jgi:hypothetical protein
MNPNPTHHPEEVFTDMNSSQLFENCDQPVIRIDLSGKILYANKASYEFLNEWQLTSKEYIPESLVQDIPGILDLSADFSAPVKTTSDTITIDIIGFKECGYIGLYGFRRQEEFLN